MFGMTFYPVGVGCCGCNTAAVIPNAVRNLMKIRIRRCDNLKCPAKRKNYFVFSSKLLTLRLNLNHQLN
jgi:hypothetical protein